MRTHAEERTARLQRVRPHEHMCIVGGGKDKGYRLEIWTQVCLHAWGNPFFLQHPRPPLTLLRTTHPPSHPISLTGRRPQSLHLPPGGLCPEVTQRYLADSSSALPCSHAVLGGTNSQWGLGLPLSLSGPINPPPLCDPFSSFVKQGQKSAYHASLHEKRHVN